MLAFLQVFFLVFNLYGIYLPLGELNLILVMKGLVWVKQRKLDSQDVGYPALST